MANPRNFNPGQLLVRWGWEPSLGIGVPVKWHDVDVHGEEVAADAKTVERTAIQKSGARLAPLIGKLVPGGNIVFDVLSPRQDWWILGNLLNGYDVPGAALETGAYLHKISSAGASQFPASFALRVDRNDGQPSRYTMCRMSQLAIKFGMDKPTEVTATAAIGQEDFWGDIAVDHGGAGAVPYLRGQNDINYLPAGTLDLYVKIIAQTSSTVDVQFKRGSAATYGATVAGIPRSDDGINGWWNVTDENGLLMGDRGMPTQILFPLTGAFTALDEFHFPTQTADWSAGVSYPQNIAVNEIYSSIVPNGLGPIEIDDADLTLKFPAEAKLSYGLTRQAHRTRVRGFREIGGKINREYQPGFNWQRILRQGTPFSLVIDMHTRVPIGTTGLLDYSAKFTMPNCIAKGKTASAKDQKTMPEAVEFTAHPASSGPYLSDFTAELVNEIPSLLATDAVA